MAVVITLIMTSTFVGCSSTAALVKETKETEAMVVKEETVEVAEVKEVEAEPTPEPTPEPIPEAITEETRTIDMESTLPGKDWLKTFKGIVEEPIFVVFNDETNKKVMVEIGGKVFIEEGDFLALYNPNGVDVSKIVGSAVKRLDTYSNFTICTFNKEEFPEENNFTLVLDTGEEFTCIMVADFD